MPARLHTPAIIEASGLTACECVLSLSELIDSIIACLRKDRLALRAASLVCTSWNVCATRYLFFRLDISPQLPAAKAPGPYVPHWLALKSLPRICHSVRTLKILDAPLMQLDHGRHLSAEVLHHTLDMFPFLQTLLMSYALSRPSSADAAFRLPRGFTRKLASVEVTVSGARSSPAPVHALLGVLTHLDKLTYWHGECRWQEDCASVHQAIPQDRRVHVNQLTLNWLANGPGLWRLGQAIDLSKLRTLSLQVYTPRGCPAPSINQFLSHHAASLSLSLYELNVEVCSLFEWGLPNNDDDIHESLRHGLMFTLNCFPLPSIRISVMLADDQPHSFTAQNMFLWEPLVQSLFTAPKSHIAFTVQLRPHFSRWAPAAKRYIAAAVHALNWGLLERLLETRPVHGSLRVHLEIHTFPMDNAAQEGIMGAIPARVTRILDLSFVDACCDE